MKGFLLGSALILLSLSVLGLAIVTTQADRQRNSDMLRLSVFDRIGDEFAATENGYRTIVSEFINLTIKDGNVTFSDTLSDSSASNMANALNNFSNFVETNSGFSIRLNATGITNELPFTIQPSGILYNHPDGFGGKTIEVTNAQQVTGYSIAIMLNRTGATPVEWRKGPYNDSAGIAVSIVTGGLTGNDFSFSGILSRTQTSKLRIKIPGEDMFVNIGDNSEPGKLTIENEDEDILVFVNTTIMTDSADAFVAFPVSSINITAEEYNISRVAPVRVS